MTRASFTFRISGKFPNHDKSCRDFLLCSFYLVRKDVPMIESRREKGCNLCSNLLAAF